MALALVALWWWCVWMYGASWMTYELLLGGLFVVVMLSALVTAVMVRRHPWLFAGMVLVSPCVGIPAWTAVEAAHDYSRGTATYMSSGLPAGFPPYFLHPRLRVPMRYTGCMTHDLLELRIAVNNATVEALVSWLGPMPGSYTGPLPTDEEVASALAERGRPVAAASQVAEFPLRVEHALLELRDESTRLRVAPLHDPRLLAVEIHWGDPEDEHEPRIRVIDLQSQIWLGGGAL